MKLLTDLNCGAYANIKIKIGYILKSCTLGKVSVRNFKLPEIIH